MPTAMLLAAFAAAANADLQATLDEVRTRQDVPGVSAVVVQNGEVAYAGGSGVADIETGRKMHADTVVYMGSLSKVLTAALTLNLVEDGLMALDDDVTQLLTHRSGIPREGSFDYWFTADFPNRGELRAYVENAELHFAPGTGVHYSNVGYSYLGLLIEEATQGSYADVLQSRILAPLGMAHSGVREVAPNVASGYTPPGRIIPNPERPFAGVGERVGDRHVRAYHNARAMSPAFGVYSSAADLGILARFLLGYGGGEVLSQTMRRRMRQAHESGWGLGLKVQRYRGRQVNRHDGWFAAHRSHLLLDVANDIAVVVMANSDNATPGRIADALYDAALGIESE